MQHRKNFHETKTPNLFGMFGRTSTRSRMNASEDRGVVAEEININLVKARVDRMRAEAFQTSRYALM